MTEDTQILVEKGAKEEIGIVDEPLEKIKLSMSLLHEDEESLD
jgi:hypothetical protein